MSINNTVRYRSDIDGLRAVAILLVVFFHSGLTFFSGGFVGVDVFFVISGFLIGGIINKEVTQGRFSYSNFYTRRIKRIAPALIAMLVLCSIFSYYFLSPEELKDFSKYTIATLLSVPNIALWQGVDYFSANSELNPLLMTWSLGVEEQFYIFLPIIFTLCFARHIDLFKTTLFITLTSFVLCAVATYIKPLPSFYLLPTRAWEMGVGVLLSLKYQKIAFSKIVQKHNDILFGVGAACILMPAVLFNDSTVFPGYMAAFPVIGAALIILSEGRVSKVFLSNRVMVFIGLISYSWYLWHWPLLSFARIAYNEPLPAFKGVLISTISLVIAYFSYKFVEIPFRKKSLFTNKKVITGYLATLAIISAPMLAFFMTGGLPYRVNEAVLAAEASRSNSIADRCLVADTDKLPDFPECMPAGNSDAVALLGDSHAAALRGGVDHYANLKGLTVYQLTKSSCPNLIDTPRYLGKNPEHATLCNNFNQKAIEYINSKANIKTVIIAAFWDAGVDNEEKEMGYHQVAGKNTDDNLTALRLGLEKTISTLKKNGKDVMLVKDVPLFKFDVVKEVVNNNMDFRHFVGDLLMASHDLSGYSDRFESKLQKVDSVLDELLSKNIKIINPQNTLCNDSECEYMKESNALYYDRQHLNKLGAIEALKSIY
ncbi:acyltransferase family protein [Klebsiella pneumoniae]|uniref:acyltransferase family protein n=1 Tax=Klebsiella pneumoniae TaxID=573 RepID=UPI002DBF67FC|nr:acyltransferase family protein [Klebsiella pneumoniae]MEC4509613.1 acyltransferase family protein [Klebsiella pneumoniae]HDO6739705.1 acyltransferase [Klebsiella pneumoniae]